MHFLSKKNMMGNEFRMIAKTFNGLENVLAEELVKLGADDVQIDRRAVSFVGDKALMYRANLALRTAVRVLKPILTFTAKNADEVYDQVKTIEWNKYLSAQQTFAIDATVYSEDFRNSQFVKYRVKDAIADWFMEHENRRPSIRIDSPDIQLNVHISHDQCTVSLDSSGESLHKRGYRDSQTEAPINEALAAGLLLLAGWDGKTDFVDPMCGSGTFLIEAALIALNIPPCIYRRSFAFEKWSDFDAELFDTIYNDDSGERTFEHRIVGCDLSARALKIAEMNIKVAGLAKYITLEQRDVANWQPQSEPCLLVTNPPYGERLVDDDLPQLYENIGKTLKRCFAGSTAWVLSSNNECLQRIGLHASEKKEVLNGALECQFLKYELFHGRRNQFLADRGAKKDGESHENRYEKPRKLEKSGEKSEKFERRPHKFHHDDDERPRKFADRKSGEKRFDEKKFGDKKFGDKKFGDRKFGGKKFDDRREDRKFGDKPHFAHSDDRRPRHFDDDRHEFKGGKRSFNDNRRNRRK